MRPEPIIRIGALAGVAISAYQIWLHLQPAQGVPAICDLTQYWNCTSVMNSSYGYVFGVPVSYIGLTGFAMLFALMWFPSTMKRNSVAVMGALGGGLFSAYLTYAEFFILHMVCPFCLAIFFLIWSIAAVAIVSWGRQAKEFILTVEIVE